MIRVATTMRRFRAGVEEVAPDGYTTGQQLEAMRSCAHVMLDAVASTWTTLRGLLEREQIRLLDPPSWTPEIHEYLNGYFSRDICPVLTPLAFDPGHPFPFISNLSMNFAVVVRHGGRIKFARVKVPDVLPRFVPLPESLGHGPAHLRVPRRRRARQHPRAVPGHAGARRAPVPHRARRRPRDRGRGRRRPARERGPQPAPAAARPDLAAAGRGEHAGARARHPGRELRGERRRGGAVHRASGLRRLAPAGARPPPRPEGPAVLDAQPVARRTRIPRSSSIRSATRTCWSITRSSRSRRWRRSCARP